MNKLFTFLGIGALVMGCGGSSTTDDAGGGTDGSSGTDGAKNDGSSGDSGGDTGVADTGTDSSMQGDGGGPMDGGFECMNPTTCGGGNTFCCGTIVAAQGQPPQCFFSGTYSTKCTMTCATSFNAMCGSTSTRRLCSAKAQCTENTYNQCCTVMLQNQAVSVCMSSIEAQAAQAQCL